MLFFVFKQKTAYEMRISDWSSDVCSSDLITSAINSHLLIGMTPEDPVRYGPDRKIKSAGGRNHRQKPAQAAQPDRQGSGDGVDRRIGLIGIEHRRHRQAAIGRAHV